MVKRRTIRDRVIDREEKGESSKKQDSDAVPTIAKSKHYQKKLTKRLNFADKMKEKSDAALAAKASAIGKKRRKKGSLAQFHDLMDVLPDVGNVQPMRTKPRAAPIKMAPKVLRGKARTKLVTNEVERFNAVLTHPAFKANPLDAIKTHLKASLEATEAKRQQAQGGGDSKSARRRKSSKKRSQESQMET
mmetsp:Transcript_31819/g.38479  ORF Transcript_31819/g.38479 Transcript_31819/m.38479 type:complete len:190 (+) Transcript_31819:343-912(+)|eukprot:CAMPEP_0197862218 /NCGR_PEP_ID=MMETSP1438-20131217/38838_1 /TAXON_ID=1461541 /ORGANISM="Pterosperma sp., Strain CCMP1384" /LENGTH=189 /DNA_ID=CAMNT_0043479707 /DNA_START=329 /DNA_END=898 /DNA_ORIENTATION=-